MTYEPLNKMDLYLSTELTFPLKPIESAILSAPWPDLEKIWAKYAGMAYLSIIRPDYLP